jgi:hypothetical protein
MLAPAIEKSLMSFCFFTVCVLTGDHVIPGKGAFVAGSITFEWKSEWFSSRCRDIFRLILLLLTQTLRSVVPHKSSSAFATSGFMQRVNGRHFCHN